MLEKPMAVVNIYLKRWAVIQTCCPSVLLGAHQLAVFGTKAVWFHIGKPTTASIKTETSFSYATKGFEIQEDITNQFYLNLY